MQCANKKNGFRGLILFFLFQNRGTDYFSQNNVKKQSVPSGYTRKINLSPE